MAVTVDPKSKKLCIRFWVTGYSKQFYLSSGLKDTVKNRPIVDSRWELIQREISLGIFDHSLERYKFGSKEIILPRIFTIGEIWDKFCEFKFRLIKSQTQYNYSAIGKVIKKLPQSLISAAEARNQLLNTYSYHVARKTLSFMSMACDWAVDCKLIIENPYKKLLLSKKKTQQEDTRAFTLDQRDLIISVFENSKNWSHYTPIIKFLFFTGCRPGEAFALTWGDISDDCTKISISKSYATATATLGATKNNKKRVFPCGAGSKLQKLLLSIRPPNPESSSLIFRSRHGQRVHLRILWRTWSGYWSVTKKFYPGLVRILADKGEIPYLTLYATRHTFATWAIAHGSSPEKVAYWLGDNVSTVLKYYCHPEVTKAEAPDF